MTFVNDHPLDPHQFTEYFREVMRRDEEACELRSDILRKNALIADLTLMNERLSVGKDKELITSDLEGQRSSLPTSDGALELELAQTKVCDYFKVFEQKYDDI